MKWLTFIAHLQEHTKTIRYKNNPLRSAAVQTNKIDKSLADFTQMVILIYLHELEKEQKINKPHSSELFNLVGNCSSK